MRPSVLRHRPDPDEAGGEAGAAVGVEAANALRRVLAHPVFVGQLVEALQGGLRDLDRPCVSSLSPMWSSSRPRARIRTGKERPLDYERSQDHAERQEDDEVAVREGRPCGRLERQREGRCQRDNTPHPGPRYDRDAAPGRWGSRSLMRRMAHLGTYVAGKTQIMRTRMTVRLARTA